MQPGQTLPDLTARILAGMTPVLPEVAPDLVLVQGDTTTTLATALAAFYARVPIGHVEAGLRTGNMHAPWPEEMNRRLTAPLCALHFAPTPRSRENLRREGIAADGIHVTGNTVIDALLEVDARLAKTRDCAVRWKRASRSSIRTAACCSSPATAGRTSAKASSASAAPSRAWRRDPTCRSSTRCT